jgi:uncharacterized coiled-coil protein SlyX
MNDDTIQDLKQFIAATVSQQTSDIRTEIKQLDEKLSNKIDDLSNSVGEALDKSNEAAELQLNDHEQRIIKLEQKIA